MAEDEAEEVLVKCTVKGEQPPVISAVKSAFSCASAECQLDSKQMKTNKNCFLNTCLKESFGLIGCKILFLIILQIKLFTNY